ncbi:MAG: SGNH/GDSL hydrolase family protein [Candidatus Omnitrophica bacterium]|nr:SGNH/GDSL hydrolase family protein [Candidatus Omnitrophota bacterium]
MTGRRLKIWQGLLLSAATLAVPVLALELYARVKYWRIHRDVAYLTTPPFRVDGMFSAPAPQPSGAENPAPPAQPPAAAAAPAAGGEPMKRFNIEVTHVHARNTPDWYYKLKPGSYLKKHFADEGQPYSLQINERGFRGKPFSEAKAPGTIRVAVMGGSSAMSLESPDDQTFAVWLQRELGQRLAGTGTRAEVLNLAIAGHYAKLTWNLFSQEVVAYDPDLVILYTGANDANPHVIMDHEEWRHTLSRLGDWLHNRLYYASMAYTIAVEKFAIWRNKDPVPFIDPYPYRETYVAYLQRLVELAKSRGIGVVCVREQINHEDTAWFSQVGSLEEMERRFNRDKQLTMSNVYPMRQRILQQALGEFAQANGLRWIDPVPGFEEARAEGTGPLFFDIVHLTPAGNRLLAQTVAPAVADEIAVRRRAAAVPRAGSDGT